MGRPSSPYSCPGAEDSAKLASLSHRAGEVEAEWPQALPRHSLQLSLDCSGGKGLLSQHIHSMSVLTIEVISVLRIFMVGQGQMGSDGAQQKKLNGRVKRTTGSAPAACRPGTLWSISCDFCLAPNDRHWRCLPSLMFPNERPMFCHKQVQHEPGVSMELGLPLSLLWS